MAVKFFLHIAGIIQFTLSQGFLDVPRSFNEQGYFLLNFLATGKNGRKITH